MGAFCVCVHANIELNTFVCFELYRFFTISRHCLPFFFPMSSKQRPNRKWKKCGSSSQSRNQFLSLFFWFSFQFSLLHSFAGSLCTYRSVFVLARLLHIVCENGGCYCVWNAIIISWTSIVFDCIETSSDGLCHESGTTHTQSEKCTPTPTQTRTQNNKMTERDRDRAHAEQMKQEQKQLN